MRFAFGLISLLVLGFNNTTEASQNLLSKRGFAVGVTHVAGNYRFTKKNFLVEGAEKMVEMGVKHAFFYLTPTFRKDYPDGPNSLSWPKEEPASLAGLAQTGIYKHVFSLPFQTIVLTAASFANGNRFGDSKKQDLLKREENEFYDLTRYLLRTYKGKNMIFILKHWEGDWMLLHTYDGTRKVASGDTDDMINWLKARQQGVSRARKELGSVDGVEVYNAVEVNRVLDYTRRNLDRIINLVVPKVGADMVSYSSYDAMIGGDAHDKASTKANLKEALSAIDKYAPDPLKLGKKRIFISEFGIGENKAKSPEELVWRIEAVLDAAHEFGASFAFFWELYDNGCNTPKGVSLADHSGFEKGAIERPVNASCKGLWLVKPDGKPGLALSVLKPHFQ